MQSRARTNAQIQLSCLRTCVPLPPPQVASHDMVFILSPFVLLWRQCGNKGRRQGTCFGNDAQSPLQAQRGSIQPSAPRATSHQGHRAAPHWGSLPLPLPHPSLRLISWTSGDEQPHHLCFPLQQNPLSKPAPDLRTFGSLLPCPSTPLTLIKV